LRFTVLYLAPLGQDVLYSNEKCELGRNFANKIWNAGRFLQMNAEQISNIEYLTSNIDLDKNLDLADKWILSRLNSTISELNKALDSFYINDATKILYDFIWHDYCDWFVEMVKTRLYGSERDEVKKVVLNRAIFIYEQALKLLHPFMPFVTEEIWQSLAERKDGESIMTSPFPVADEKWIDRETEADGLFMQNVVNAVRTIRGELDVPPSKEINIILNFHSTEKEKHLQKYESYLKRLTKTKDVTLLRDSQKPRHSASAVVDNVEIFIPLEGLINLDTERERIQKEIDRVRGLYSSTEKKLSNESFVSKAPKEVVDHERNKLDSFKITLEKLEKNLENIS
jgi:valyl-tRNA synthetase